MKFICKILSDILLIIGFLYGITVLYSALSIMSGWNLTPYGDGKYLHINYPFTSHPFMNIDNNNSYFIFSFISPMAFYTLFFLFASKVFKVFYQPSLFTNDNLKHLKRFYLLNLLLPLPLMIISSIFTEIEATMWLLLVVHIILGVFTFLTSLIFQQGLKLQYEQDLFI